jgi:hypothetical protein
MHVRLILLVIDLGFAFSVILDRDIFVHNLPIIHNLVIQYERSSALYVLNAALYVS